MFVVHVKFDKINTFRGYPHNPIQHCRRVQRKKTVLHILVSRVCVLEDYGEDIQQKKLLRFLSYFLFVSTKAPLITFIRLSMRMR